MKAAYRLGSRIVFGGASHGDWVYERMRHPRTLLTSVMNVGYYAMGIPRIWNPISVIAEANFGCNLKCSYCWGSGIVTCKRPRLMSWEVLRRLMDVLPNTVETVQWAGLGEPLIHPDLKEMTDYVVSRGRRVLMFTNGTLLRGKQLDMVVSSKLDVVNVSVDVEHEAAKKQRGIDLDEIRENVRELVRRKPPGMQVKVSMVITPENVDHMNGVWEYWGGLAEEIKFSAVHDVLGHEDPGKCLEVWRGNFLVSTEGTVSPCCFDVNEDLYVGNIFEHTLVEIAHGPKMRAILEGLARGNPPPRCMSCRQFTDWTGPLRTPRANKSSR